MLLGLGQGCPTGTYVGTRYSIRLVVAQLRSSAF